VSRPSGDAPPRLPHGYTNATFAGHRTSSGERTIVKRYLGPDAEERLSKDVGHPIEDLAWAEWIVRTHHPHLTDALGALFDGFGIHPPWLQRHSAMLAKCAGLLAFARRWSAESAGVWQRRIEATEAFAE
jgi:hypothetical protein